MIEKKNAQCLLAFSKTATNLQKQFAMHRRSCLMNIPCIKWRVATNRLTEAESFCYKSQQFQRGSNSSLLDFSFLFSKNLQNSRLIYILSKMKHCLHLSMLYNLIKTFSPTLHVGKLLTIILSRFYKDIYSRL